MAVSFTMQTIDTAISAPWLKTVGDVNGDGRDDLLIGNHSSAGGLFWYRAPDWTKVTISASQRFITDGEVADIDRDGRNDVVAIREGGLDWYDNGDAWNRVPIGTQVLHDVEIADLDGDGDLDVVGRNQGSPGGNTLYVYRQNSPTSWSLSTIAAPNGEGLHLVNVDRDGDQDIVVNGRWYENQQGGWVERTYSNSYTWGATFVAAGDINGDGRVDLLLSPAEKADQSYRISWFEAPSDPRGLWTERVLANNVEAVVHTLRTGDFDRDGDLDILYAEMSQSNGDDEVGLYLNNGSGGSWTKQVIDTSGSHSMRVLDADNDGDLDLLGANWQANGRDTTVKLWINGTPQSEALFTSGRDVVDLNDYDLADYDQTTDALAGDDEVTLSETQNVGVLFSGGDGDDLIFGSSKADTIRGQAGNDPLWGRAGDDVLQGGVGNDRIAGQNGNDELVGNSGADYLDGGAGADVLDGGFGNDRALGGDGGDRFVFTGTSLGKDRVLDFTAGLDELYLDDVARTNGAAVTAFGQLDTSGDGSLTGTDAPLAQLSNGLELSLQGGTILFIGVSEIDQQDVLIA